MRNNVLFTLSSHRYDGGRRVKAENNILRMPYFYVFSTLFKRENVKKNSYIISAMQTLPHHIRPSILAFTLLLWCLSRSASAQSSSDAQAARRNCIIRIEPMFGDVPLRVSDNRPAVSAGSATSIASKYSLPLWSDSIEITALKFYLSHIALWNNGVAVWRAPKSIHLVNAADTSSLVLRFALPDSLLTTAKTFPQMTLHCELGVDSLTNVSGAVGGDADPTKGMYWAWQSGYINFKLEGKSLRCPARNNTFHFHIGGYRAPFQTLQTLQFPINEAKNARGIITLRLQIDVQRILASVNVAQHHTIMSPSAAAASFAQGVARAFRLHVAHNDTK
jgi:hypothetical protein